MGWVMVESVKTGNRYVASSTGLPFETKYVKKAEEIGFDKMTVGEVMSKELGCGMKATLRSAQSSQTQRTHTSICAEKCLAGKRCWYKR